MAAQTPKAPNTKTGNRPSTTKRSPPNRAQLKAMEARAASAARAAAFARGEDVEDAARAGTATSTSRTTRRSGVRAGAQREVGYTPASTELSVRAEMEYHRRDLIRLLLIAAVVIVLYVVLWFFLK